jgi:SAM-dependent methyltransferase
MRRRCKEDSQEYAAGADRKYSAESLFGGYTERLMTTPRKDDPRSSYDAVAEEYVKRISGELEHKPFDRELLDRFAEQVTTVGPAADIGCGPGHVTRYLHDRGVRICGVDLSPEMVRHAKALNSGIDFLQSDMRSIAVPDGTWAGIVALYSLIHIPRDEVVAVLCEFKRAMRAGAILLLGFHEGDQILHLDDWWGRKVCVDFVFFQPEEMREYLEDAGFAVSDVLRRGPYAPEVEHQSPRCYMFARA